MPFHCLQHSRMSWVEAGAKGQVCCHVRGQRAYVVAVQCYRSSYRSRICRAANRLIVFGHCLGAVQRIRRSGTESYAFVCATRRRLRHAALQIVVKCEQRVTALQQEHLAEMSKRDMLLQRAADTIIRLEAQLACELWSGLTEPWGPLSAPRAAILKEDATRLDEYRFWRHEPERAP